MRPVTEITPILEYIIVKQIRPMDCLQVVNINAYNLIRRRIVRLDETADDEHVRRWFDLLVIASGAHHLHVVAASSNEFL